MDFFTDYAAAFADPYYHATHAQRGEHGEVDRRAVVVRVGKEDRGEAPAIVYGIRQETPTLGEDGPEYSDRVRQVEFARTDLQAAGIGDSVAVGAVLAIGGDKWPVARIVVDTPHRLKVECVQKQQHTAHERRRALP